MNSPKTLTRSSTDRQIGGVCGGLAHYFGLDPTLVRVGFIVGTLMTGVLAIAYLAMLLVMPSDDATTTPPPHDPLPA